MTVQWVHAGRQRIDNRQKLSQLVMQKHMETVTARVRIKEDGYSNYSREKSPNCYITTGCLTYDRDDVTNNNFHQHLHLTIRRCSHNIKRLTIFVEEKVLNICYQKF